MKDPAILFYTQDFLVGTMLLTDEQVGKYIRLLCLQHQKGHLSKEHMLSICKTYDKDIFDKFAKDKQELYFNVRMEEEIIKRSKYSESRRKNAKNRGKKDKAYAKHMENENEDTLIGDMGGNKNPTKPEKTPSSDLPPTQRPEFLHKKLKGIFHDQWQNAQMEIAELDKDEKNYRKVSKMKEQFKYFIKWVRYYLELDEKYENMFRNSGLWGLQDQITWNNWKGLYQKKEDYEILKNKIGAMAEVKTKEPARIMNVLQTLTAWKNNDGIRKK